MPLPVFVSTPPAANVAPPEKTFGVPFVPVSSRMLPAAAVTTTGRAVVTPGMFKVPPLKVRVPPAAPRLASLVTRSVPPEIVVPPEYELLPVNVSLPTFCLTSVPEPSIVPA